MFREYLNNGGESATIKWYADNGGLKPSHFNNMTETQFAEYVQENGDKDFVNNYIVYC